MSKFTDAVALAKAGFKAAEIKQMLEEKENDPDPQREEKQETQKKETDPPAGDPQPDPSTGAETDPPAGDPEPDLKYQELEDKYNELLGKYQQMNIREDISENSKSNEEDALDIMASMIGG